MSESKDNIGFPGLSDMKSLDTFESKAQAKNDFCDEKMGHDDVKDYSNSKNGGLQINWMNMKDARTGRLVWRSGNWGNEAFDSERRENIPKEILQCRSISREMNFSSKHELRSFHIEQYVFLHGHCIEQWSFHFGFVMPGSTNTWQQVIEAAPPEQMLDPALISGHITFQTCFFDGENLLAKNVVRIHYV